MLSAAKRFYLNRSCLFFLILSIYLSCGACAAQVIQEGSGNFDFEYEIAGQIKKIPVHYYAPHELSSGSRIVFVLHGAGRSGKGYRDEWRKYAQQYSFLVLCPEFSEAEFPGWWQYNAGNVYDEDKKRYTSSDEWSFNVIEGLFDFVRKDRQMMTEAYCMFGHSAGAQFVHRMVLFMPQARFSMAIANGAGSYTYPLLNKKLVEGLQHTSVNEQSLRQSFEKEMIILVGKKDLVSKTRPQSPKEFDQYDRVWMAWHFYEVAQAEAKKRNIQLNWHLRFVPNADHNSPQHAKSGSQLAAKSKKILGSQDTFDISKNKIVSDTASK